MFGLRRYAQVVGAYIGGLEERARRDPQADLSSVVGVASFFVGRVDVAVDRQLAGLATAEATALRGRAAIAQAKSAYQLFNAAFTGPRRNAPAARGARSQRLLWASTSVKDPALSNTRHVDELIGPETITTLPPTTLEAVTDHRTLARTVDRDLPAVHDVPGHLDDLGIDLDEVSDALEVEGISSFSRAFSALRGVLSAKAMNLSDE